MQLSHRGGHRGGERFGEQSRTRSAEERRLQREQRREAAEAALQFKRGDGARPIKNRDRLGPVGKVTKVEGGRVYLEFPPPRGEEDYNPRFLVRV